MMHRLLNSSATAAVKLGAILIVLSVSEVRLACGQLPPGFVDAAAFGFNPVDATAALQAAINTGSNVYVPKMASDWIVTPITLSHSNQEIRFESGVVVAAKPGAFLGVDDALFSAVGKSNVKLTGYGATFRMRKSDYQQAPYAPAEWRHGVNLLDVSGFEISGLSIQDTGGDGVYVGTTTPSGYSSNVVVKDVKLNNNHRQGISVISVQDLLVDNAVITNTSGTAPEAGIDFEVNYDTQRIMGVEVRDSIIQSNDSYGILFAGHSDLQPGPISASIENVTILSNQSDGIRLYSPLPGVTIRDSLIVGNAGAGLRGTPITAELLLGEAQGTAPPRNAIEYSALRGNALGSIAGWARLGTGSFTNMEPVFYSQDPASPYFLYLHPNNSAQILQGAQDGGYIGARPRYVASGTVTPPPVPAFTTLDSSRDHVLQNGASSFAADLTTFNSFKGQVHSLLGVKFEPIGQGETDLEHQANDGPDLIHGDITLPYAMVGRSANGESATIVYKFVVEPGFETAAGSAVNADVYFRHDPDSQHGDNAWIGVSSTATISGDLSGLSNDVDFQKVTMRDQFGGGGGFATYTGEVNLTIPAGLTEFYIAFSDQLNASHSSARFAFSSLVVQANLAASGIPGDYNKDGQVDAADYTVWRDDPETYWGSPAGFNIWKANFGRTSILGAGNNALPAVPEASGLIVVTIGLCAALLWRRM